MDSHGRGAAKSHLDHTKRGLVFGRRLVHLIAVGGGGLAGPSILSPREERELRWFARIRGRKKKEEEANKVARKAPPF